MTQPTPNRSADLLRLMKHRVGGLAYRAGEASLQAVGLRPPLALLILGHMRSGSSLLLHLLLTNPRISALGERNATYATREDLVRLAAVTRLKRGRVFTPLRYVADQVNHNRFTPNLSLLSDARVRTIFLLRRPLASLASLMELSRMYYGQSWTISRAADYYATRVQFLGEAATSLLGSGQAVFVTYEQLTESPAPTLAPLQEFLKLATGFSTEYECQPFTRSRGDPGTTISSGKIVRANNYESYEVPADELERATQAYLRCRQVFDQL
jgi:hypothetical protein